MKDKILTLEDEQRLVKAMFDGDPSAAGKLLIAHEALIRGVARKWKRSGDEDLLSALQISFLENIGKFKPEMGYRISTYLRWHLNEATRQYIQKTRHIVTTGDSSFIRNISHISKKITEIENRGLTPSYADLENIAKSINTPVSIVEKAIQMEKGDVPLDAFETDGEFFQEEPTQEEYFHKIQHKDIITKSLSALNDREKYIILKRHYTEDDPVTLDYFASIFQISRERVRQIESKAIKKIKNYASSYLEEIS